MVAVLHQELADEQHQDKAWQHDREGGQKASEDTPGRGITGIDKGCVAHIRGRVDADGPWSALTDSDYVRELPHRHPMIMPHDFALYHGYHGISPAETEEADEEEGPEELYQKRNHLFVVSDLTIYDYFAVELFRVLPIRGS
jgi:hypothetical protein